MSDTTFGQKHPLPARPAPRVFSPIRSSQPSDVSDHEESASSVSVMSPLLGGRRRRTVTVESHLEKYDALIRMLSHEIDRKCKYKEKGVRTLQSLRRTLEDMRHEVPKLSKRKRAPRPEGAPVPKTGLTVSVKISDEFAAFMRLDECNISRDEITRNDATNAICVYAHYNPDETRGHMKKWRHLNPDGERDLQDPNNRKAIIPDKVLSKLLGYEEYRTRVASGDVKRSKKVNGQAVVVMDDALYYYVIQRLITPHFV